MNKKTIWLFVICCTLLCSCGNNSAEAHSTGSRASSSGSETHRSGQETNKDSAEVHDAGPVRDNTPNVLVPDAEGTTTYGTDIVTIDASHPDQGYVMVKYLGTNPKVKLQISTPKGDTYTYLLSQEQKFETFPLPGGDGTYSLTVLENVEGDMYSIAFSQDVDAQIADEFLPFLYPNQYVNFTSDSKAIAKGKELAEGSHTDLEVLTDIYHYVTENITYDDAKATSVSYGYLPDIDQTLAEGKGICFDYAAVMSAMLRSQSIPTKLEVGYAGEAYHAWISTYVDDIGWVDNIIEFDGSSWSLMDPTYAANTSSQNLKKFIGSGDNYVVKYSY